MTTLLQTIFNHDFAKTRDAADFHAHFFGHHLTLDALRHVFLHVNDSSATLAGRSIPGALLIKGKHSPQTPFAVLAMLHGNEPAGLAGIALILALAEAGQLEQDVLVIIGNRLAAAQYFESLARDPRARQETRDVYRCGLGEDGALLPDLNRIPVDFMSKSATTAHALRAQELFFIGQHISGIADIHSARGNMVCITDHKRDADLRYTPIRAVLTGLAEAISAHASAAAVTVQTLKTLLHPLSNITCQIGIEAGRHEAEDTPDVAAAFTLALLYNLQLTAVTPLHAEEDGVFMRYNVQPRLSFADLNASGPLAPDDKVHLAMLCDKEEDIPKRSGAVIVETQQGLRIQGILEFMVAPAGTLRYAVYQYDEMEPIEKDQVVAVAVPSGVTLRAPFAFSTLFISKHATLYDKDPAVGPWPVAADKLATTKFCYPCEVSEMTLAMGDA